MDGATVFQMISGLGRSFGGAYSAGRAQAQEDEAPAALENLLKAQQGASAQGSTLGSLGESYTQGAAPGGSAQPGRLPAFAGGDASMRIPAAGGPLETRFVDALKAGGLTNPAGLAAMTAYANRESGFKPSAITGSWSDPSESGQPGTSGGILSWRGDRFANMRRFTAGAEDPVVAQAKFALTENPTLTQALQNAKSAEEANSLMANAWRFAGFNRPGGEMAARLGTTKAYLARLGGAPGEATQVAQPQPARQPQAPAVAAVAPASPAFVRPSGPVMTMPDAPVQQAVAPAPIDAAASDKPAPGAQPTGFMIPGQDAAPAPTAAPQAAPQGFVGFGAPASRVTPEMQEALKAAWRNPNTRPMATAIYGQMLKGQDSAWKLTAMGDQPVLFNERTAQIVPVGQAKRQTATVGNTVIDTATGQPIYRGEQEPRTATVGQTVVDLRTGQPIYQGEKDEKYSYQNMPGVGMVALHPTDPAQSRVIVQGQPPRPMTDEEAAKFGKGYYDASGAPHVPKPGTVVNVDTKGAGKFIEKANELQAKRYGDMVEAADNAVPLRADIETMASLGEQISTGKLAEARLGLAQYAKAAGLDTIANGLTAGKMGEMEAYTALADKITPRMRVPGSGSTSDAEGRAFKNSLPSLLKSAEGNRIIVDTFRGLADYQAQAGDLAGRALRGEMSQAEADQAIRALPNPYTRFKEYQGKQPGAQGSGGLPKEGDRVRIPGGMSAAAALAEARKAVANGKDPATIRARLRSWGIDDARLDQ